jgi:hypothetical protein
MEWKTALRHDFLKVLNVPFKDFLVSTCENVEAQVIRSTDCVAKFEIGEKFSPSISSLFQVGIKDFL